jgi:hypothetical protein
MELLENTTDQSSIMCKVQAYNNATKCAYVCKGGHMSMYLIYEYF